MEYSLPQFLQIINNFLNPKKTYLPKILTPFFIKSKQFDMSGKIINIGTILNKPLNHFKDDRSNSISFFFLNLNKF